MGAILLCEIQTLLLDLLEDFQIIFRIEWVMASQDGVYDHANGPNVAFVGVGLLEDLWRDVENAPTGLGKDLTLLKPCRLTEVDQLDDVLILRCLFEQDILQLDVPMHDPDSMQICHCRQQLFHQTKGFLLTEVGAF